MKCINRQKISVICGILLFTILTCGCSGKNANAVTDYEKKSYDNSLYTGKLYAENLCVAENDVALEGYAEDTSVQAAALYAQTDEKVLYSYSAHKKVYPASITKIMTALLALEHGNLNDQVVISANADASSFPTAAQVCGIKKGQTWSLEALLNALLLYSGNDVAVAIAEHIGGTEENFVQMMNERAKELMAWNTHYCNPHGLHEDEHYTTAYDIYLIFQKCIQDERFVNIINQDACTVNYTEANGAASQATFRATNYYARGLADKPDNVTILGGKTGTTDEGGYCLILLEKDAAGKDYISVVMGAREKSVLYQDMTSLIQAIP